MRAAGKTPLTHDMLWQRIAPYVTDEWQTAKALMQASGMGKGAFYAAISAGWDLGMLDLWDGATMRYRRKAGVRKGK